MKTLMSMIAAAGLISAPAFACDGKAALTTASKEITTIYASHHSTEMKDIVATADAAGFSTLLTAASAAGLAETLSSDGPFTVFAPTDEAFAKLGEDTITELLKPENKHKLADILKYHVVSGEVKAADLAGKRLGADSLNGTLLIDGTDGVTVNGTSVVKADVKASNGVIHVIDEVLMPAM